MGYPELVDYGGALQPTTNGQFTVLNIAATAAQYVGFAVSKPVAVKRITYYCATATTGGVLNVTSAPTYASGANAVTLGTMTLATAGVGTVFYKDITDKTVVPAGYQLNLNVVTAGGSGTGWFNIEWEIASDTDANQTSMVKGT
jgi:hypothetical protein